MVGALRHLVLVLAGGAALGLSGTTAATVLAGGAALGLSGTTASSVTVSHVTGSPSDYGAVIQGSGQAPIAGPVGVNGQAGVTLPDPINGEPAGRSVGYGFGLGKEASLDLVTSVPLGVDISGRKDAEC